MIALVSASDIPLDPAALGDEIARTAAHLDAATHRLLACIRTFDASGEWERQGALSCAHWLAWRIGLDPGTAREKVRVARALGGLPRLDDGLRRGELSYAKVRALTRVATLENEATLAEMARSCTGAQLERLCRSLRRVIDVTEQGDRLDDRRYVKREVLENGMVRLSAVLHADEAALVMKAIDEARRRAAAPPAADALSAEAPSGKATGAVSDVSAEVRPATLSMPDALVNVARAFLTLETPADLTHAGGELCVHLDQDPLGADGSLAATLDDGTRLSAETWRRLTCDTSIVPVRHAEAGNTIGRRTRIVAPALRRALWVRDRGCRFPGCSNHLFVHAHHIRHWARGGPTTRDNLVLLCSTHHRLVHEGGFTVRRQADGDLCFADPQGRVIDSAPRPAALEGEGVMILERAHADAGLHIDAETGRCRWEGDAVDYQWAVDAVLRESYTPIDPSGFPFPTAATPSPSAPHYRDA